MMTADETLMAAAIAVVAGLYSSVGHGGASGYLAIMALLSFPPQVMKPGALALNLLVAGIGAVNFIRAGHFRWPLLWPFAVTSIPLSYIGARFAVPPRTYAAALAVTLVWAGCRMALPADRPGQTPERRPLPSLWITLTVGAVLGFVSGMVGVGGGIFLSPLVILMRWADPKQTAALSAAFIWLNSASGMFGHLQSGVTLPEQFELWVGAAALGGMAGSYWGSRKFTGTTLRRLLAVVLLIAAAKSALIALQ